MCNIFGWDADGPSPFVIEKLTESILAELFFVNVNVYNYYQPFAKLVGAVS